MIAAYLREQHRYTLAELTDLLGADRARVESALQRLAAFKLVKLATISDNQGNLADLADNEPITSEDFSNLKRYYVFTFVGLIVVGQFVLKCYPKYFRDESSLSLKMSQIMRVLERYKAREQAFDGGEVEKSQNLLALMVFLTRDFLENGIYSSRQVSLETNGPGEIHWDRTINENFALLKNARPYYVELKTARRTEDEQDFFRKLHASTLTKLTKELRDADLLALLDMPELELSADPVDFLGETTYLLSRIEGELNVQFDSRKLTVLKALHAYLSNLTVIGDEHQLSAIGTNSFNLVWESVCSEVFGNQRDVPLSTLPLPAPLGDRFDPNSSILKLVDRPVWADTDEAGEFAWQAEQTLVPDLVSLDTSLGRNQLVILDAKYYRINLSRESKLSGYPGIGDVTKQYLYQLALRDFAISHDIQEMRNCFLFPSDGTEVEKIGHVSLNMLRELALENIQLRLLPASVVYDLYLQDKHLDLSWLEL